MRACPVMAGEAGLVWPTVRPTPEYASDEMPVVVRCGEVCDGRSDQHVVPGGWSKNVGKNSRVGGLL